MDVKEVLAVLSENVNDVEYSSLLYENPKEKKLLFLAAIFFVGYIAATFICTIVALFLATFSLVSLILYSLSIHAGNKDFIKNPIRFYVGELGKDIEIEHLRIEKLSNFSKDQLVDVKNILEFENLRFKSKVSLVAGALEKVGVFPSLLALFYAFHEYSTATESMIPPQIILGLMIGLYFGLFLTQRIINWQNYGIYLLNKALNLKSSP